MSSLNDTLIPICFGINEMLKILGQVLKDFDYPQGSFSFPVLLTYRGTDAPPKGATRFSKFHIFGKSKLSV